MVLENLDWLEFISRYDRKNVLFYIDPPYWGNEGDYGKELFSRDQFELMAKRLAKLKGKFILSINNTPEVMELFKGFKIEKVELSYSVGTKPTQAHELIICNY